VDLTFDGASGTINGAVFMTGQFQQVPDHFYSFLELRNNGTEQGYNTDGTLQYNDRDVQNSTHSVLFANVPIVVGDGSHGTTEGVAYREFRLNIAEAGNTKQFLSLDGLQIFQEESGSLTSFTPGTGFAGSHTNYLAYNMDASGDHWVGLLEPDNGNGQTQTEFTILVPDSDFINDPTHRYITLYAKFGQQVGWEADSGSEEVGLGVISTGPTPAMTVHKTATVDGGTANVVGEVISYGITVANVGDVSLTGITVTDPSVSNLAPVLSSGFNVGDTNHDNQLSAGETWSYTASHTVTQTDINSLGGGDGFIDNTVTADSAQTTPVSATASVMVESNSSVDLTKTADVSSVNATGNVIHYTITAANTGITTLTNVQVNDSQVNISTPITDPNAPVPGPPLLAQLLNGDYNVGDTNQNGFQDPGETFQYVNAGDTNQNGVLDPGETFLFTNIGDTNQNGFQDGVEVFQYYNVGDTNHNGVQDGVETFQFDVSHAATYVSGDTNSNGQLDVGETWVYSVNYTVTQSDIDNGGVVQPGLTHDNTATVTTNEGVGDSASASVTIVQNPHLTLTKTATVADGTADHAGDVINYAITVANDGNMTLTSPLVSDPAASTPTLASGDTNSNGKIDVGETWNYTASHIVTQSDIDNGGVVNSALTYSNTASVTTDQGATDSDSASVPIVQDPHVTLTKTATVADGTADHAGDVINYAITVANDGNMTLTTPVVSDPAASSLTLVSGDTNSNGKIDVGETWNYTASHTVTQSDIDNGGAVNPLLAYDNTASISTHEGASASDSASVPIVQDPAVTLAKSGTVADGTADTAGDVINYAITIHNGGNMTLTNPVVSDPSVSDLAPVMSSGFNAGDTNTDGKLSVGETWQYTSSYTVTQTDIDTNGGGDGTIDNTASVTTDQGATSSASAHVTVVPPPVAPLTIDDNGMLSHLVDPGSDGPDPGDSIQFFFTATNHTSDTLTSFTVTDTAGDIPGSLQNPVPSSLGPLGVYGTTFNHILTSADVGNGFVDDDVTASGVDPSTAVQMATLHYHFLL
jgi:uncharacterized repeat protein (TIGR01451 family)